MPCLNASNNWKLAMGAKALLVPHAFAQLYLTGACISDNDVNCDDLSSD